jgi:polar amino acid transport system substrate-binding protein
MKNVVALALTLSVCATIANAQQTSDARVADLVRAGKIRAALFLPQYTTDTANGEVRGAAGGIPMVALGRALAARLGLEIQLVGFPTPIRATECVKGGACDVILGMGIEPGRMTELDFSPPFIQLDFTYLVPPHSSIRSVADADRPGIRIAAVRNHASTLGLSSILKQAQVVYADTPDSAFQILRGGQADALAQARPVLLDYSAGLPGSWVLLDSYGAYFLGMALAKGQPGRLAYISEFVEQAKASGLVQRAIDDAGLRGVQVPTSRYPVAR